PEAEVRRAGAQLDEVVERLDESLAVQPPRRQLFELIGRTHPRHGRLTVHLEPHGPLLDHGRVGQHSAATRAGGAGFGARDSGLGARALGSIPSPTPRTTSPGRFTLPRSTPSSCAGPPARAPRALPPTRG